MLTFDHICWRWGSLLWTIDAFSILLKHSFKSNLLGSLPSPTRTKPLLFKHAMTGASRLPWVTRRAKQPPVFRFSHFSKKVLGALTEIWDLEQYSLNHHLTLGQGHCEQAVEVARVPFYKGTIWNSRTYQLQTRGSTSSSLALPP